MTNKTTSTDQSVTDFLAAVDHPIRRADSLALAEMIERITGFQPKIWGGRMIGYGRYDYTYDSGHSGTWFMTGFAPSKTKLTVYIMPGYQDYSEILGRLGKYKMGKSCLYINKLADVDQVVLEELISAGFAHMCEKYGRHG